LGLPGYSVTDPDRSAGFGGINTYVGGISGSAIDFSDTNSSFTLEAWVNGPASQMEGAGIIAKGRGSFGAGGVPGEQFTLDVNSGVFRFRVEPASGTVANATAAVGPDGTWQHVVAVYDGPGGSMQIYVNGQES